MEVFRRGLVSVGVCVSVCVCVCVCVCVYVSRTLPTLPGAVWLECEEIQLLNEPLLWARHHCGYQNSIQKDEVSFLPGNKHTASRHLEGKRVVNCCRERKSQGGARGDGKDPPGSVCRSWGLILS
jgi:hypothetical protein